MAMYDRTGGSLSTFQMNRWKCLRQEHMIAGDTVSPKIKGWIRLAALRETISLDVQMDLCTFFTPYRYLWSEWPEYVKEGVDGSRTIPTRTQSPAAALGLGSISTNNPIAQWYVDNYLKIYNWYFKWPESPDVTSYPDGSDSLPLYYGFKAIALESILTRMRNISLDDADHILTTSAAGAREQFDLRDVAQLQARFKSETSREWLAKDRYKELIAAIWKTSVSNDAEQRPRLVDHRQQWMSGEDVYATDGNSLGSVAGVMRLNLNHNVGRVTIPEGGILSYFLCLRFPPYYKGQCSPMATTNDWTYADWTGDPDIIEKTPPRDYKLRNVLDTTSSTVLGTAPFAQQLRTGWSFVDTTIQTRDSFPIADGNAITANAGHIGADVSSAFVSQSLGHAMGNIRIEQPVRSIVPDGNSSIYAGAD